ncbi:MULTISPECIES: mannose-1-phosphate guanylyltransferase [Empedobacter]|uniref:mannose-1-phosphate guanylyltransferase n=1 Tax=Empedobacter TaxID=59734 RepID=UPI0025765F17|nr:MULTISPECIES: mannose-1-phosphate guanylyltransferase [Empedobacter]MDM1042795.1 NTP transferase domain-containing protein [Empedobacter brevis]MDM1136725.1 NTP transferase domain-containing protein [Empedobacter sp. R750]
MKIINVILTGGVGSRLWPLSRKEKPKQYIDLFEGKSLFQQTIIRNKDICDELIVVGNVDNYYLSRKALEDLKIEKFHEVIEATPRNTAAAIAFAAFKAQPEDILLVSPSDHLIEDLDIYNSAIQEAIELAKKGSIVTFGLQPTKPETGYGYIQIRNGDVLGFREKPNLDTAQEFLKSGDFYWNSGMFCFKADTFLNELKIHEPEVYQSALKAYELSSENILPLAESLLIPSISVDYAVMEKTEKLQAVIGNFKWSDMGSFESIYDYLVSKGKFVDKHGNMVIGSDLHTEFLGFKKSILVITDDAILVLKKEKAQDVKGIYENLSHYK